MEILKKIWGNIKKIKIQTLLVLIVILSFTSYAWFVYISKVSAGLSAHVEAWQVTFAVDDEEIHNLTIDVGRIYPGMDDFTQEIRIVNNGEIDGEISFEVTKMIVLGTTYEASGSVTTADLTSMLQNDFPFSIDIQVSGENNNVIPAGATRSVNVSLVWPFEGDDDVDTKWGEDAYEYYKTHGADSISVHIDLNLKVNQVHP